MKYSDLSGQSNVELLKKLKQARLELFQLRMKHQMRQLEDKMALRKVRKSVARILTVMASKK